MSIGNSSFNFSSGGSLDDLCKKWGLGASSSGEAEAPQIDFDYVDHSIKIISGNSFLEASSSFPEIKISDKKINVFSNQSVSDDEALESNAPDAPQADSMSILKTTEETSKAVKNVLKNSQSTTLLEVSTKVMSQAEKNSERMINALGLNVIPDIPEESEFNNPNSFYSNYESDQLKSHYEKCNEEKKEFVGKNIDNNKIALVLSQANEFPEMRQKMNALRENLDRWDHSSLERNPQAFNELKSETQSLLESLTTLSDELSKVSQQENPGLPKTAMSPAELQEKRKKEAVSTSSIRQQADLHQAIRTGKGWAQQQPQLNKLGTSVNSVYRLDSSNTSTPAAFFKVGQSDETAAGTMEKLLWDIAVVMGLEEQFVPTGETKVRTQSELTGGTESVKQWDEKGELKELTAAKPGKKGGIQVAQKGETLGELMKAGKSVSRDEVVDGTLTSLVFGMFDAHPGNIFVTDEGKIKFFDNTRSLPNSNGFIDRGFDVTSAYRCSLLDLPSAKTPLTPEEIGKLKEKVKDYQLKMNQLKKYLASKENQIRLNTLPPGWLNLTTSLIAMENRIYLMEAALAAGDVKTLEDLATQSNPNYKLAYALTHLERLGETGGAQISPDGIHAYVGYYPVTHAVQHANDLGISLEQVEKWCKDPTVNMEELSKRLATHYNHMKLYPLPATEHYATGAKNLQIWEKITKGAVQDYKDVPRNYALSYTDQKNVKTLCQNGVVALPETSVQTVENAMYFAKDQNARAVVIGNNTNRVVVQNTPVGFRVREFDASFKPGMIREKSVDSSGKTVFGNEMSIPHFNISIVNPPTEISLKELRIIPQGIRNDLVLQKGIMVSKATDGNLMLSCRVRSKSGATVVINPTFTQISEGKFLVLASPWLGVSGNRVCSINEIVDLFQGRVDSQVG